MFTTLTHPGMRVLRTCAALSLFLALPLFLKANCYNDYHPPIAICDAHTVVSLGSDGVATVYASTFDDGSYDDCQISHFLVRRMSPGWCPYGVDDDTEFRPYVQFCCEDVSAGYIWVVFRVVDASGNYNDCMVQVDVQDKLDPWIWCPPDITVSCNYWFNPDALWNPWDRTFGTVVTDQSLRQPIIINDPGNNWYSQPHNWGLDGYAKDNCEVSISISNVTNSGNCGAGVIHRTFKATDWGGRTAYCTQKITIKNYNYGGGFYINWPDDYIADGCDYIDHHPDHLPHGYDYPTWNSTGCGNLIGYNFEDQVFHFVEGACSKILRKWTVIDWCLYDPHHPYSGIWTHTQIIKLANHNKPWFEKGCHDIYVDGNEPYCKGKVYHDPQIWDDCTPIDKINYEYKVDIHNDGSIDIIRHGKRVLNETLPAGWHKVIWYVDDGCGNQATCTYKVHIQDKKKPTPVCYYGLSTVVMPSSGMITIWAKDFNASSFDNCTPQYALKYSFSANPAETSRVFTCDDIGTVPVQVWVHDQNGNKDYCTTFIIIADNEDVCPGMQPIQGLVSSFAGEPVEGAEVMLYKIMPNDDLLMDRMKLSDENGHYVTGFGTTQYDRFLTAQKNDEQMKGINTLDLILLQHHIMGTAPFTMTEQYLAADIDGSKHTGVKDMLRMRNLLLGAKLENGELPWLFFPDNCTLPATSEPYNVQCATGYTIDHTVTPQGSKDFFTIKVGDINGDVVENISGRASSGYPLLAQWYHSLGGEQVLSITAGDNTGYLGMQISMHIPTSAFSIESGALKVDPSQYSYNEETQYLRIVLTELQAKAVQSGDILFKLRFAQGTQNLSGLELDTQHGSLKPELYTPSFESRDLVIHWGEIKEAEVDLEVRTAPVAGAEIQVAPNPFDDITRLYVPLQNSGQVGLEVTTLNGELVFRDKFDLLQGTNVIEIEGSKLGTSGVFIYRVHTNETTYTGKMMRIQE